jgi:hypothetical protein
VIEDPTIAHTQYFGPWRVGLALGVAAAISLASLLASTGNGEAGTCVVGAATVRLNADTKISQEKPTTNFGRSSTWAVGPNPTGTGSLDTSFVRFPLPALPPACTVTDAELLVAGHQKKPDMRDSQVVIYRNIKRPWHERGITYNDNPTIQDNSHAVFDRAWPGPWNVTKLVRLMYQPGRPNFGLMVYGGNIRGGRVIVDSRESSHPPRVRMAWGPAPVS